MELTDKSIVGKLSPFTRDDLQNLISAFNHVYVMGVSDKTVSNLTPIQREVLVRLLSAGKAPKVK